MRRTIVITTDDLDGSEGATSHTFALDGQEYTIDLGDANYRKLCDALERYIDAGVIVGRPPGRQAPTPRQRQGNGGYSNPDVPIKEVRQWWLDGQRENLPPPSRFGRVPQVVIDAWRETLTR